MKIFISVLLFTYFGLYSYPCVFHKLEKDNQVIDLIGEHHKDSVMMSNSERELSNAIINLGKRENVTLLWELKDWKSNYLLRACSGYSYLLEQGVCFRDLKYAGIFYERVDQYRPVILTMLLREDLNEFVEFVGFFESFPLKMCVKPIKTILEGRSSIEKRLESYVGHQYYHVFKNEWLSFKKKLRCFYRRYFEPYLDMSAYEFNRMIVKNKQYKKFNGKFQDFYIYPIVNLEVYNKVLFSERSRFIFYGGYVHANMIKSFLERLKFNTTISLTNPERGLSEEAWRYI